MKITLAKALIVKNRLVQELSALDKKIQIANSCVVQALTQEEIKPKFTYDFMTLLKERHDVVDNLVKVKVAIALANKDPEQQNRIFRLSELKTYINLLKSIPATENRSIATYRSDAGVITQTFVQVDQTKIDATIKHIQEMLDAKQEEMEKFNWATEVDI